MSSATRATGTMRSNFRCTLKVLTFLGALVGAAPARAACDGGEAELNEAIGAALGAWSSASRVVYPKARASVETCLNETRDVLGPETVAAWFRFLAVDTLFQKKDRTGARLALAASHAVDPDFAWEGSVLATNSDLPPMIEEAKALSPGDLVPIAQDPVLRTYVNGRVDDQRPVLLPVLLQVESPSIGVLQTLVLAPGQDWNPEQTPGYELARASWERRQAASKRALKVGAGLVGAAVVVGGGASLGGALARERASSSEVKEDILVFSVGGQIGAGVLAGAGLTSIAVGVGRRW